MNLINLRGFLLPSIVLGGALHADTVLLDHTFDGVANDIGPAFQQVTNGGGTGGSSDPSTGLITTGNINTSTYALNNVSTLDVAVLDPAAKGFTITFEVGATTANVASLAFNGMFFGVVSGAAATGTTNTSLWNQDPNAFGYVAGSASHGDHLMRQNVPATNTSGDTNSALGTTAPSDASFQDGFTISISIYENDTWSLSSTGLSTELSGNGTLNLVNFSYADIITNLGLYAGMQGQAAATLDIERIMLTTRTTIPTFPQAVPAAVPSMVLLDHTFDGVANDIGPAFQQVTNLRGGTADTATGVISTGVTQTSSTAGFNNASTLDIPTLDPAAIGFTATFHFSAAPAAVSSLGGNGFFMGIVSGASATGTGTNSLHRNGPAAFGYTAGSFNFGDNVMLQTQETDAAEGEIATALGTPPTNASFADGFTVSISVFNDNTWTITSTGLDTDLNGSGILNTGPGYSGYADIASDIGLFTTLQRSPLVDESATVERITLTTLVPAEDLRITSINKTGGTVTIEFEGTDGATYDLNKSTTLDFSTLNSVDSIQLNGTNTGTLEDANATESAAFYRIEAQ